MYTQVTQIDFSARTIEAASDTTISQTGTIKECVLVPDQNLQQPLASKLAKLFFNYI